MGLFRMLFGRADGWYKCSTCNGSGEVEDQRPSRRGAGQYGDPWLAPCKECRGEGRIYFKDGRACPKPATKAHRETDDPPPPWVKG